jgi:CubicO group peptidase (beta-lactamase class C family)
MKKIIFLLLFCPIYRVFPQTNPPITSLRQLLDSIHTIVQQQHMVGLMLGITTKNSVIFSGGFGFADLSSNRPVTGQTLFRMGSVTKSFVAVGILQLAEAGKLKLNQKLRDIAPEVPFTNPWEGSHPIRIIDLLEHTTGFDDMKLNEMYTLEKKDYSDKEMMQFQRHSMVCRWQPGERQSYCNVNYVILGYIIQKITGLEYGQYLKDAILIPLRMSHSNFNLYSKYPDLDVKEYVAPGGKVAEVPSVTALMGPAASLWSSSDDMIHFLQFYLNNGMPLLSENSLAQMEQPHSSLAARAGLHSGYAIGNEEGHYYNRYPWRGHEGIIGTCNSLYLYNRTLGLGFVLSCNGNSSIQPIENLVADFLERNQPDQKFPNPKPLDPSAIQPYLGLYQNAAPRYDLLSFMDMFTLTKVEITDKAVCLNEFGNKTKVIPTGPLTFKKENANKPTIVFAKNATGEPVIIIDGVYCEQVNTFWAYTKIAIILIALLFIIISIFLPLVALISALRKKLTKSTLPLYFLPLLSLSALIWAMTNFSKVQAESYLLYQLREVSTRSLAIFAGTLLFGLLTTVNLALVIKAFSSFKSGFAKWYLLVTAMSFMLITIILLCSGWFGLRTWAM